MNVTELKIAWRNMWRNPRRTILTLAAISFACLLLIFMLSFQFGSYSTMIDTAARIHTGHLQVQADGYNGDKDIRKTVTDPEKIGRLIRSIPEAKAYSFRANGFALVSSENRTYGAAVFGVDPGKEAAVSRIKNLVQTGSYLGPGDYDQVLIGDLLAKNLKIGHNDELTLLGQGRDGSIAAAVVRVKGIFRSGQDEFDRNTIQVPLTFFQETFSMGDAVHEIVIIADALDSIPLIKEAIENELENTDQNLVALDWKELIPGLSEGIAMDLVGGLIMYFLLILVVAFSILNTFLMAILERTREFGVLMAIGTTPRRLTHLLLTESMCITLLGICIGSLSGCIVTLIFQHYGIEISGASEILKEFGISGRIYPRLSVLSATIGPVTVFFITLVAALYPALKVQRLKPVEALAYA